MEPVTGVLIGIGIFVHAVILTIGVYIREEREEQDNNNDTIQLQESALHNIENNLGNLSETIETNGNIKTETNKDE